MKENNISSYKIIDLTLTIFPGMPQYEGEPPINFELFSNLEKEGARGTKINLSVHTGTHIDSPKHRLEQGKGIDEIPLTKLIGNAITIDFSHKPSNSLIEGSDLEPYNSSITNGDIVIFYTRTAELWCSNLPPRNVYLDKSGAEWLVNKKVNCVGIDSLTIESPLSKGEVHKILLSNDIIIIEGLSSNIKQLIGKKVFFVCAPMKLKGLDGAPARAFAILNKKAFA
ncbi:MAG: cyclase family protein [Nitrososphaeria archaeon]